MRRFVTAFAFALVGPALAFGAGCTFLISFDDVPIREAGAPDTGRPSPIDTGSSSSSGVVFPPPPPVDAAPPPPTCDPNLDMGRIQGCDTFIPNAQACASNSAFIDYPFTTTRQQDLITCRAPDAICVEHCETRCAPLPRGFPDQCDRCRGKTNGTYCSTEMGWDVRTNGLIATCTTESLSKSEICSGGCVSGNGAGTARCTL